MGILAEAREMAGADVIHREHRERQAQAGLEAPGRARCVLCDWHWQGTVRECAERHREHRAAAHPELATRSLTPAQRQREVDCQLAAARRARKQARHEAAATASEELLSRVLERLRRGPATAAVLAGELGASSMQIAKLPANAARRGEPIEPPARKAGLWRLLEEPAPAAGEVG